MIMKIMLVLLVACQVDQTQLSDTTAETYDVEGQQWTRTTNDRPWASVDPKFVANRVGWFLFWGWSSPLNECVAVDINLGGAVEYQRWLTAKVEDLLDGVDEFPKLYLSNKEAAKRWLFKEIKHTGFAGKTRDYRRPSIVDNGAKVLCVSIYELGGDRLSVNMFSFWDGQKAIRVGCRNRSGNFVCHDINDQEVWRSNDFAGNGDFISNVNEIRQTTFEGVSYGRVKINVQSLGKDYLAFLPFRARELNEYNFGPSGNTRNFTEIVSIKTGEAVLRPCEDGFRDEVKCKELGVKTHAACNYDGADEQERPMCKIDGRGMLIKYSDDDILRVANCEYQEQAEHFYCSDQDEVYFERYGVKVIKKKETEPPAPAPEDDPQDEEEEEEEEEEEIEVFLQQEEAP